MVEKSSRNLVERIFKSHDWSLRYLLRPRFFTIYIALHIFGSHASNNLCRYCHVTFHSSSSRSTTTSLTTRFIWPSIATVSWWGSRQLKLKKCRRHPCGRRLTLEVSAIAPTVRLATTGAETPPPPLPTHLNVHVFEKKCSCVCTAVVCSWREPYV